NRLEGKRQSPVKREPETPTINAVGKTKAEDAVKNYRRMHNYMQETSIVVKEMVDGIIINLATELASLHKHLCTFRRACREVIWIVTALDFSAFSRILD